MHYHFFTPDEFERRVAAGEMPPHSKKQPDPALRADFSGLGAQGTLAVCTALVPFLHLCCLAAPVFLRNFKNRPK